MGGVFSVGRLLCGSMRKELLLEDLVDISVLRQEVEAGYVTAREHNGLVVYNYSKSAQYERRWNPVTRLCRGLVTDLDGCVLARPFPKFFNVGEPDCPPLPAREPDEITVKEDGSLGILFAKPDGSAGLTTRGSLLSDQAAAGREVLDRYGWVPPRGVTFLTEIITPSTRVVVDYGDREELVLLAVVDNSTGLDLPVRGWGWPARFVETVHKPFGDLIAEKSVDYRNREGFVFRWGRLRAKLKYDRYVEAHRLVTGMNEKHVWQLLADGADTELVAAGLPEEFEVWWSATVNGFRTRFEESLVAHRATASRLLTETGSRKEYAGRVLGLEGYDSGVLFALADGNEDRVRARLWGSLKPGPERT